MKFHFAVPAIVVEASSEEDAVGKIGSRLSAIARHLGNEVPLKDNRPFFTLTKVADKTEAVDLSDPIVEARLESERLEREKQTITEADVGDVSEVLGEQ